MPNGRVQALGALIPGRQGCIKLLYSPSPPSDGGEGRGEEARFHWAPLLGPLPTRSSRGEEESLMQPCPVVAAGFAGISVAGADERGTLPA